MAIGITLIGNVGRLYSGYKLAATINQWEAVRTNATLNDQHTECRGRITEFDRYWITQPITRLALRIGRAWWVWSKTDAVDVNDSFVTVRAVGEPELVYDIDADFEH